MPARKKDRPLLDDSLQFAKSDSAAGKRYSADERCSSRGGGKLHGNLLNPFSFERFLERRPYRQSRSAATEGVEDGNYLRHGSHRGAVGHERSDEAANDQTRNDDSKVDDAFVRESYHYGKQHADGGQQVAAHGSTRMGQTFKAEDKKQGRGQV